MLMWEVVVDGSRISGIVVVEISLLAKVLWNDLKYIETCVLKLSGRGLVTFCWVYAQPTLRYVKLQVMRSRGPKVHHQPGSVVPTHCQAGQLYLRELRGLEASARVTGPSMATWWPSVQTSLVQLDPAGSRCV